MPRISDLPLTTSVDEATALIAVSSNGTTYKITPANLLASSGVGVSFYDSDSSHLITLAGGSNLSANRTLTLTTGDADRTLDISAGNTTISAFAITILDDANAAAVRSTLGLGSMALETATDYLTVASAVSGYQPLDADLTTLAANITAFGHDLVDSANAAAARTTLGLGTAAVENIGTSGATVPLLNGTNVWSGSSNRFETSSAVAAVHITSSASYAIPITIESTNDDALAGPFMNFQRISATPAATDLIGGFNFRARNNSLTEVNYCTIQATAFAVTAGAETGRLQFNTFNAGSFSTVLSLRAGVFIGSPTGFDMGTGTLNAVTLYENGTSLAAKYQGLDSELTAIAGLTSAADRLPYFTGSGTAALATFTTAGRNLIDDADASAQRTTLGLGTAATQNTGTSGATIPLLNAGNTWSSQQIIEWTASPFGNGLVVQATEDSGGAGPGVLTRRISTSPAAFDQIGFFQFQGRDSGGNNQIYASLSAEIVDPTSGSEDGGFSFNTAQAGSIIATLGTRLGVFVGSPTGGDQGTGTINAVTLYENGTSLASKYGRLAVANTWSASQTISSSGGNELRVLSTTAGVVNFNVLLSEDSATAGPYISTYRNSASPAASDQIGVFLFRANNSTPAATNYAALQGQIIDPTAASEDGRFDFQTVVAGALATRAYIQAGAAIGSATGGDKGVGTLNAVTLYEDGTSLATKYARLGSANTFTNPQRLPSYAVASLPAGAAGDIAFASNGRKNGEGAGAGTGVLVFHDGTAWRACDTGATAAA